MFCSDKPIDNSENDLLNRTSFSKQLAKAILSYTSKDNFTISLCGKWGSGKTSILNMVEGYIADLTKNDEDDTKPLIIHFNPWNYSDRSQLTVQFFQTLLSSLNMSSNNNALKKVGDALQHYSSFFEYAELIPVAGKYFKPIKSLASGLGEGLTDLYDSKDCLEQQKLKVIDALSSQNQKLIVIIDDIDRLNNEQIRLIFQLVNSLAGFPNMIYLLSFDREVVARALSDEQKCNGDEYLEKIIQVPFDVPEVQMSSVHQLLFDRLDQLLFKEIPCDNFDKEYWDSVFQCCISPFIKGIRDVNRIINAYSFKYRLMHDETNCIDLLALTTLQICAPSIFNWIYQNEKKIVGSFYGFETNGVDQKKTRDDFLKEFEYVYKENPDLMLQVIQTLFPIFSWISGGYCHDSGTNTELRRKQKIACSTRFPLYFSLSLDSVVITKQQIVESINHYSSSDLELLFTRLTYENKLYEYVEELNSYVPDIPDQKLSIFLKNLVHAQPIKENNKRKGRFQPSPAYMCERCCWTILKRFNQDRAEKEIIELLETSDLDEFSAVIRIVFLIERSYGRIGDSSDYKYRVVEEKQLDNIEKVIEKRLKSLEKECNLLDAYLFNSIYRIWNYFNKESLKEYLKKALKTASNIPKYLSIIVDCWDGSDGSGWYFKEYCVSDYMSLEAAYEKICALKGTDVFNTLEFKLKEITIAFYLWYNSNRKDREEVSKDEVDKLIPEWERRSLE